MKLLKPFYICLLIVLLLLGDYSYSLGRWNTGETLFNHCTVTLKLQDINNPTSDDHAKSVGCLSYLEGVKQLLYKQESITQERNICFPDTGISNGQAARIVVNYLNEHPEKLQEHKLNLVLESFSHAFPCK
jgi:hypothetical protein